MNVVFVLSDYVLHNQVITEYVRQRPEDRVAVKPHASPIFHALQYLMGNQTQEKMENFRGFGGVQSYPSRTKDIDDVDFSTGSVGLGVAITSFASIVQDYIQTILQKCVV